MPQEDKIKREIDRIGMVLAKLLGVLLNKNNHHEEAVKDVARQMQDELHIDLPVFLDMDQEEALRYLAMEQGFSPDHLRVFANLLYETAGNATDIAQRTMLKSQALAVYEYIDVHAAGTLYLDVVYRIRELKQLK